MRHFEGYAGHRFQWRDSTCWAHSVNSNMDLYVPGDGEVIYEAESIVVVKWKLVEDCYPGVGFTGGLMAYDVNIRDVLSKRFIVQTYAGIDIDEEVRRILKEKKQCST